MSEPSTVADAAISCRQSLQKCVSLMKDGWAENRLIDFNLWSAGSGACAEGRTSLDDRLLLKPDIRDVLINLLLMLRIFAENCRKLGESRVSGQTLSTAVHFDDDSNDSTKKGEDPVSSGSNPKESSQESQELEARKDVEETLDHIIRLTVAVRKAGSHARLRKADTSFDPMNPALRELKRCLEITLPPRGFKIEGQMSDVHLRLIEANLRRHHRFMYARKHSKKLASGTTDATASQQQTRKASENGSQKPTSEEPKRDAGYEDLSQPNQAEIGEHNPEPSVIAPTVKTAASAIEGSIIIPESKPKKAAATLISQTSSKISYPRPPRIPENRNVFKCPCCCQPLPVYFSETSQWKKHLTGDILPYTCILNSCTRPAQLYLTQRDWEDHMNKDHSVQYWSCFACQQIGTVAEFGKQSELVLHLETEHLDAIEADEIPMFVEVSSHSKPAEIGHCPVCKAPEEHDMETEEDDVARLNHIAQCVHDFSLKSLPWEAPGDQEDFFASDSEQGVSQNRVSLSDEERDSEGLPELDYSSEFDDSTHGQLTVSALKLIPIYIPIPDLKTRMTEWLSSWDLPSLRDDAISPVLNRLPYAIEAPFNSYTQQADSGLTRLIVGVDFGTTHSGLAYTASNLSGIEDIQLITKWPNAPDVGSESCAKVPSRIAYLDENRETKGYFQQRNVWGYEVTSGFKSYSWFKLLLDKRAPKSLFDDPVLLDKDANKRDSIAVELPKGKSAEQVVTDYLTFLHDHCMNQLGKMITSAVLDTTPIDFWFTHPITWSAAAKEATERAAKKAGFGQRATYDTINWVSEPEAAAITKLRDPKGILENPQPGSGIVVCGCGGSTVVSSTPFVGLHGGSSLQDVTTYTIRGTKPYVTVDEAVPGEGGKCGSTAIDRRLYALLSKRFAKAFSELPPEKTGVGSRFMRDLELGKCGFDGDLGRFPSFVKLKMRSLEEGSTDEDQYDFENDEIFVSAADFKECFDPVVAQIIRIISHQIEQAQKKGTAAIKLIILAGGFADSLYLWKVLHKWCHEDGRDIELLAPREPWSAIVRGAALRGLEGSFVRDKYCKRHYGIHISKPYDGSPDISSEDIWENPFRGGEKFARGYMDWRVKKGEKFEPGESKVFPIQKHWAPDNSERCYGKLDIYECSLKNAPDRQNDFCQLLGTVKLEYTYIDLSKCNYKRYPYAWSPKEYHFELSCEMIPEDETGRINIRVMWNDIECGSDVFKLALD